MAKKLTRFQFDIDPTEPDAALRIHAALQRFAGAPIKGGAGSGYHGPRPGTGRRGATGGSLPRAEGAMYQLAQAAGLTDKQYNAVMKQKASHVQKMRMISDIGVLNTFGIDDGGKMLTEVAGRSWARYKRFEQEHAFDGTLGSLQNMRGSKRGAQAAYRAIATAIAIRSEFPPVEPSQKAGGYADERAWTAQ